VISETIGSLHQETSKETRSQPRATTILKCDSPVAWENLQWANWYNNERLHSAIGHRPPQEVEEAFYAQMNTLENAA
jgi:transposase InsO family protein